jgi:hypothetical protein
MIMARVEVGLGNTGIHYNKPQELGTAVDRGAVLADGAVVRGIGTHFASLADKQRYDELTRQQLKVRVALSEAFGRVSFFQSTFIEHEIGEIKRFMDKFVADNQIDPAIKIDIIDGEFTVTNLTDKQLNDWGTSVKEQIERVRLGQKKGQVNAEALNALEKLADCPALSTDTAGAIRKLVGQFRAGTIRKDDFQRSIQILDVKMDATALTGPKRSVPEV